jgi:hypothetical protein
MQTLWPELEVARGDLRVAKNRYSALIGKSSNLEEELQERGIDTVLIAGTKTNVCCECTARDAMMLDYKVVMLSDCTATLSDEEQRATLEHLGRYIARMHTVGAARRFRHRPALTIESFGDESRAFLLEQRFVPDDICAAWTSIVDQALQSVLALTRIDPRQCSACTAIAAAATYSGRTLVPISSTSTMRAAGPPCRTCGCCCPASAPRWSRNCESSSTLTNRFAISTGASLR